MKHTKFNLLFFYEFPFWRKIYKVYYVYYGFQKFFIPKILFLYLPITELPVLKHSIGLLKGDFFRITKRANINRDRAVFSYNFSTRRKFQDAVMFEIIKMRRRKNLELQRRLALLKIKKRMFVKHVRYSIFLFKNWERTVLEYVNSFFDFFAFINTLNFHKLLVYLQFFYNYQYFLELLDLYEIAWYYAITSFTCMQLIFATNIMFHDYVDILKISKMGTKLFWSIVDAETGLLHKLFTIFLRKGNFNYLYNAVFLTIFLFVEHFAFPLIPEFDDFVTDTFEVPYIVGQRHRSNRVYFFPQPLPKNYKANFFIRFVRRFFTIQKQFKISFNEAFAFEFLNLLLEKNESYISIFFNYLEIGYENRMFIHYRWKSRFFR
jgi:hypothetical protein